MRFPHKVAFMEDTTRFIAKSYGPCSDPRSWSLDSRERSQYYLELLSSAVDQDTSHKVQVNDGDSPRGHLGRRPGSSDAVEPVGSSSELEAKNKEIDDLQRRLKELEDRLKAGLGGEEASDSGGKYRDVDKSPEDCLKELERLKKELEKKNDKLEKAKKEIDKIKEAAKGNQGLDQLGKDKDSTKINRRKKILLIN